MRKLIGVAVMALVLPAVAVAHEGTASPTALATAACKTEKSAMGTKTFKQTYAAKSTSKAMKACLGARGVVTKIDLKNAAHACKAERAADPDAFTAWGTNANDKNAFGKCVSSKAREATEEKTEDRVSAADTCKAMKASDRAVFDATFGMKKNAFGKCVSSKARELEQTQQA